MSCVRGVTLSALFFLLSASVASAQPITAAIQPSEINISQSQLPLTIILGDIRGTLEASPLDQAYAEEDSAFAQITFASDDDSRKGEAAELIVEAENGEIVSIFGDGVEADERDGKHVVSITGIREKRERRVLIEMKLRSGAGAGANRLKFAMRAAGEKPEGSDAQEGGEIIRQSVILSWPVESCGRSFHEALLKIGEAGGNNLTEVWRDAQKPLKSLSRQWHFRPSVPSRSRRGQSEQSTAAISRNREREVLNQTAAIMRSGFGRDLGSRGRYGWELSKTAADLKNYFTQDYKATICTGAPGFADYYEKKLAPLGGQSVELHTLTSDAELLAKTSAVKFIEGMRNLPGGHPAWGGASLGTLRKPVASGDDVKSLVLRLLESANADGEVIAEIAEAESSYEALKKLDAIGLSDIGVASRKYRTELQQALARIEAAVRLAAYRAQYDAFWLSFSNRLKDIRAAHAEHCLCGS